MLFQDRINAANQLIPLLARFTEDDVVVMAVPRGAVPMSKVIADHYHWPLSVVLVKKIGHPHNKEYAIGAVGLDDIYLEPGHEDVLPEEIDTAILNARNVLLERRLRFFGDRTPLDVNGKTVIVVDDGIATGATLRATAHILREQNPDKIIIAAPVASTQAADALRPVVDELVILHTSSSFMSVGQFYEDFDEVTDDDVVRTLGATP